MSRMHRPNLRERLLSKATINWETGCWEWTGGGTGNGYGVVKINGHQTVAHRAVYELIVGAIPQGMLLDHLCRIRHCVNPAHLEPVTARENIMRSPIAPGAINAAKTHCLAGHEYSAENTNVNLRTGARKCLTCHRTSQKHYRVRKAARRLVES